MHKLDNRVAIVVGVETRLGRTSANRLAQQGAAVVVADLHQTQAVATAEEIREGGGEAIAVRVDVADEDSVAALVRATIETFGVIHVLHNNASADPGLIARDGGVHDMDVEVWDRIATTSVRGTLLGCKYAIPEMIRAGGGSIINTIDIPSSTGPAIRAASGCSAAAVEALTQFVAHAYGHHGIRCNAVSTQVTMTEMVRLQRSDAEIASFLDNRGVAGPIPREDPADLIAFLASAESSFMTGQTLRLLENP